MSVLFSGDVQVRVGLINSNNGFTVHASGCAGILLITTDPFNQLWKVFTWWCKHQLQYLSLESTTSSHLHFYTLNLSLVCSHNSDKRSQSIWNHSRLSDEGRFESKFPNIFRLTLRLVAASWLARQWGCPDPTGSHLLDCPLPRECGGPRWGEVARPLSFQSQSSRLLFCLSSRAQTVGNFPQPAGIQLLCKITNVLQYQPEPAYQQLCSKTHPT